MVEIDNRGGGDCGFYAFAIGLIEIIQEESQKGNARTYHQLCEQGATIALNDIIKIDLNALENNPHLYKSELQQFQQDLRNIAAATYQADLNTRLAKGKGHDAVKGSVAFCRFKALVEAVLLGQLEVDNPRSVSEFAKFNELALLPEMRSLASQIAKSINKNLQDDIGQTYQAIEQGSDSAEVYTLAQGLANNIIQESFEANVPLVLRGMQTISTSGRWATHEDLNTIAGVLEVNFKVQGQTYGAPIPTYPTVTLVNNGNHHWVTQVASKVSKETFRQQSRVSTPMFAPACIASKPKPLAVDLQTKINLVAVATASSVQMDEKSQENYEQLLKDVIRIALETQSAPNITPDKIDSAEAKVGETDEDFAKRLQKAECIKAGFGH